MSSLPGVRVERVDQPARDYVNAAWIAEDDVVVEINPPGRADRFVPLSIMRPDGSELRRLQLPDDKRCDRTEYVGARRLPDGRLGVVRLCTDLGGAEPTEDTLFAYDLATRELEVLLRTDQGLGSYTWDPDLRRGLYSVSSGVCAGIGAFGRDGLEPFDVVLRDGGVSWRLDSPLRSPSGDCDFAEGRAKLPEWSPDGGQIAFFASPQSAGVEAMERVHEPWNLYLMDPERRVPRPVIRDVKEPSAPLWSPDGKSLAFSGELEEEEPGIFLYSVEDERLQRVVTGNVGPDSWSPDGTRLLAGQRVNPADELPPRIELLRIDLSAARG